MLQATYEGNRSIQQLLTAAVVPVVYVSLDAVRATTSTTTLGNRLVDGSDYGEQ
jgi:hypothetical protein